MDEGTAKDYIEDLLEERETLLEEVRTLRLIIENYIGNLTESILGEEE